LIVCFHKARPWLLPSTHSFFTRVCLVTKSSCKLPHFLFSVCFPVCVHSSVFPHVSALLLARFSAKILYWKFLWKSVEEIRIWNRVIISGILHENLSKFYFCRRQ
jgi:hypothetical protein